MKFDNLKLNNKILSALKNIGFETATEVQYKAIPLVINGNDVVVRSQTGSGKTFAYVLPLVQNLDLSNKKVQTLVVCPTRELSLQVTEEINKLTKTIKELKITAVYGGSPISRQISNLKRKPQIVVGTPGRLLDHLSRKTLKLDGLTSIVLDEADEMLNMGFLQDIETILKATPSRRQTLMFSATFPNDILNIVKNYQKDAVRLEIGEDNKSLENIKQSYVYVNKPQKLDAILKVFEQLQPYRTIIFTNTKIMAQNLSDFLNKKGYRSQTLHGDLRQSTRKKVLNEAKNNKIDILVASDVAARGIDIKDIDYVVNYDIPNNVEYFLHRIGRTARAGKKGNAVTFVSSKQQLRTLKQYEATTNSNIDQIHLDLPAQKVGSKTNDRSRNKNSKSAYNKGSNKNYTPRSRSKKPSDDSSKDNGYKKDYKTSYNKRGKTATNRKTKSNRDYNQQDFTQKDKPNKGKKAKFAPKNKNFENIDNSFYKKFEKKAKNKKSFAKKGKTSNYKKTSNKGKYNKTKKK